MAISSRFEVIYLGDLAVVDVTEGDTTITEESGNQLLGLYGSADDPLTNRIKILNPGSTGYAQDGGTTTYEADNQVAEEKFTIDGGAEQVFDASFSYRATVKYTDGTKADLDNIIVFQDATGKTYIAPSVSDQSSALSTKPIESISLDSLNNTNASQLFGQRQADGFVGDAEESLATENSTVFDVIELGILPKMDGNNESDSGVNDANIAAISGRTIGSEAAPLFKSIKSMAPGSTGFAGGNAGVYDVNSDKSKDTFTIDGSPDKITDASVAFRATITYADGTVSEEFNAVIMQAEDGTAYLVPQLGANGAMLQHAKPIRSITLGDPVYPGGTSTDSNLNATRSDNQFVTCFAAGTWILTDKGERRVETLSVGDMVITADHEAQKILWMGKRHFDAQALALNPKLKPVRIRKGVLCEGIPVQDLTVSRQHRLLMRSKIVENMTGSAEALISAIKLTALDGIDVLEDCPGVTYFHVLCGQHEVIYANGAATESLYLGPQAIKMVGEEAFEEILTIFPEILEDEHIAEPARKLPDTKSAEKKIVWLHAKNNRQAVETA